MSKGKIAALIISAVVLVVLIFALLWKFVLFAPDPDEAIRENMKIWSVSETPGFIVMVPDDYSETSTNTGNVSDFKLYYKDDSRIKVTFDSTHNDLENYSYNAIQQYKKITDSFDVIEEYSEKLSDSTEVHVTAFDYSVNTSDGPKNFSCLSAITIGNGNAYVLTCTCDKGNYEKYKDDFVRSYKTMRIVAENETDN